MNNQARANPGNMPIGWLAAVVLGAMLSVTGCMWANPGRIERGFTTMDLLISIEKMPPGWEVSGDPKPMSPGEGDLDDSQVEFKPLTEKYNLARHWVWQYDDIEKARKGFRHQLLAWFNDNSIAIEEPWHEPNGWSYSSPDADEFHVACTTNYVVTTKEVCQAMWRYDEFVVLFGSSMRPELMTMQQFEGVVREIDRIMVSHLKE